MSKFGLGRGLEDLEKEFGTVPDMSILTGAERVVVRKIPLSQISMPLYSSPSLLGRAGVGLIISRCLPL